MKRLLTIKKTKKQKYINKHKTIINSKNIGGGLFTKKKSLPKPKRTYFMNLDFLLIYKYLLGGDKLIYREYINETEYYDYIVTRIYEPPLIKIYDRKTERVEYIFLDFGYFIDIKQEDFEKTVFFSDLIKYNIKLVTINDLLTIENKEYYINNKVYLKYNKYEDFKHDLIRFYNIINNNTNNNTNFELLYQEHNEYKIFIYEKINDVFLYNYMGEIKTAKIDRDNKGTEQISITLKDYKKDYQKGTYKLKPKIHFSDETITPEHFSSIEIDTSNKIMILRCDACIGKSVESTKDTSPIVPIEYDPRTIPENPVYNLSSDSSTRVDYSSGNNNGSSFLQFYNINLSNNSAAVNPLVPS
jgi:hypothetical protein